jgi:hypothetical protein
MSISQYVIDQVISKQIINVKGLLFNVYQNYIHLCNLMLKKMSVEAFQNVWVKQLENVIALKMIQGFPKGEELTSLIANNATIQQTLHCIWISLRSGPSPFRISPLLNCVGNIINQIDKCSPKQARNFLSKAQQALVQY